MEILILDANLEAKTGTDLKWNGKMKNTMFTIKMSREAGNVRKLKVGMEKEKKEPWRTSQLITFAKILRLEKKTWQHWAKKLVTKSSRSV